MKALLEKRYFSYAATSSKYLGQVPYQGHRVEVKVTGANECVCVSYSRVVHIRLNGDLVRNICREYIFV